MLYWCDFRDDEYAGLYVFSLNDATKSRLVPNVVIRPTAFAVDFAGMSNIYFLSTATYCYYNQLHNYCTVSSLSGDYFTYLFSQSGTESSMYAPHFWLCLFKNPDVVSINCRSSDVLRQLRFSYVPRVKSQQQRRSSTDAVAGGKPETVRHRRRRKLHIPVRAAPQVTPRNTSVFTSLLTDGICNTRRNL